MNLYDVLSIDKKATQKEVKRAYRKMAHKFHPDKGGDPITFQRIKKAYDVLSNIKSRQYYDDTGEVNETQVNNLESLAYSMFNQFFSQLLQQVIKQGQDPVKQNLIHLMGQQMDAVLDEFNSNIKQNRKTIEIYQKLVKRFKPKEKGKASFTDTILQSVIINNEKNIKGTKENIKVAERVIELLNTVDFEKEAEQVYARTIVSFSSGTNSYTSFNW